MTPSLFSLSKSPARGLFILAAGIGAYGFPANDAKAINPVPPAGVAVPDADRAELTAGAEALGKEIEELRGLLQSKPERLALLPDVQIFQKAVDWAVRYNEIFDVKQIAAAKN